MNTRRYVFWRKGMLLIALTGLLIAACSPATQPIVKSNIVDKLAQAVKSATQAVVESASKTAAPDSASANSEPVKPSTGRLARIAPLGKQQKLDDVVVTPLKFVPLTTSVEVQPKAGDRYFAVTLSIENASKSREFKFDPASLVLANTTGDSFSPVAPKSVADQLQARTLKPGAKIEGVVIFEVPQKGAEWYLEFKDTASHHLTWSMVG